MDWSHAEEAFQAHIHHEPNSGCWLWAGADNGGGYGKFRGKYAHRVSYEMRNGAIPEGLHLDHLCRVPCCVNPDHLEPVTNQENARRGEAGFHMRDGGAPVGENHPRSRMTAAKVIEVRDGYDHGLSQRWLAEKYGVSRSTVAQIVNRKTWRHV